MSDSSDESVGEDGQHNKPLMMKKQKKKAGRPEGSPMRPYSEKEMEVAFDVMMEFCTLRMSSIDFLRALRKRIREKLNIDRSTCALQTFVRTKLKKFVPVLYRRRFIMTGTAPSPREHQFLREYFRGCDWEPPALMAKKDKAKDGKKSDGKAYLNKKKLDEADRQLSFHFKTPHKSKEPSNLETMKPNKEDSQLSSEIMQPKGQKEKPRPIKMKPNEDDTQSSFRFMPPVCSTPIIKPTTERPCSSSSRAQVEGLDTEGVRSLMRAMMNDFFEEFKQEVKDEMKTLRDQSIKKSDEEEQIGKEHGAKRLKVNVDVHEKTTEGEEEETDAITSRNEKGEAHIFRSRKLTLGPGEKKPQNDDKSNVDNNGEVPVADNASGTNLAQLLSDSSDVLLVKVAEQGVFDDRSASFLDTPLRARLGTITIMEVYKVSDDMDESSDSFRVLEETDGSLTICHESAIDRPGWSTTAQVGFPDCTALQEEIAAVRRSDVVSISEGAPSLSPMVIGKASPVKRIFQTATITVHGKTVKGLLKRRDKK